MVSKTITCRGIIIDNDELLTVQLQKDDDFTCLPGGKIESFETLHQCLERELFEELGIKPVIGELAFINQGLLYTYNKDLLEFFFVVKNSEEYRDLNATKASHASEIYSIKWQPISTTSKVLHPHFLLPELQKDDTSNYPQLMVSE